MVVVEVCTPHLLASARTLQKAVVMQECPSAAAATARQGGACSDAGQLVVTLSWWAEHPCVLQALRFG